MFWNLMFIMAATVSSCERISVGPKMTPRLDTVIRFDSLCVETLEEEDRGCFCWVFLLKHAQCKPNHGVTVLVFTRY